VTSIRDPLWNTIVLDDVARRLIDTPVFQRLRYVRQLGLAHLVYPGATHTRFEHALGAYHLARRTIGVLDERRERAEIFCFVEFRRRKREHRRDGAVQNRAEERGI
jgi:HD superfamily phosphohydrolase